MYIPVDPAFAGLPRLWFETDTVLAAGHCMYVGYCLVSIFVSYTVHQSLSIVGKCKRKKEHPAQAVIKRGCKGEG
jgi:hypothetical protein